MLNSKNIFTIKKKIIRYYYIVGNNVIKKQKCKKFIKNKIINYIPKINILYIFIWIKTKWQDIYKKIHHNNNLISKKKLIIINFLEKNKNLEKKIFIKKKFFLNIYKNIFIIFNFEYNNYLIKKNIFKKNKSLIINCNNSILHKKNILEIKHTKNINIQKWIKYLDTKNIKKNLLFLNKIKNDNVNKLLLINILFQFIIKKKIKILNIINKYEINIKNNQLISWYDLEILSIQIIKI